MTDRLRLWELKVLPNIPDIFMMLSFVSLVPFCGRLTFRVKHKQRAAGR
jgi:hypothetical protein